MAGGDVLNATALGDIVLATVELIEGVASGVIVARAQGGGAGRSRNHGHSAPAWKYPTLSVVRSASAPSRTIECTTILLTGSATADARAKGKALRVKVKIVRGKARGSATARGAVIDMKSDLLPGTADGFDAIAYDNDFLLAA